MADGIMAVMNEDGVFETYDDTYDIIIHCKTAEEVNQLQERLEQLNAPKSIARQIQDVADDMCNNYCKYPETWNVEAEGCELSESEVCANCPLSRLV